MRTIPLFMCLATVLCLSCSKDDDAVITPEPVALPQPPTIELTMGSTDLLQGVIGSPTSGSLQATVKAEAKDGFKNIEIFKVTDGEATSYEILDKTSQNYVEGNVQTYQLNYIFTESDLEKEIGFKAVVTDVNDAKAETDLGMAIVKRPLMAASVTFKAEIPLDPGVVDVPHYLFLKEDNCLAMQLSTLVEDQGYEYVAAVFSFNDGSGFYLASPNKLLETDLVLKFQEKKSTTQFKVLDLSVQEFNAINLYDTFKAEALFDEGEFGSDPERAEQLVTKGKVFSFRTDDMRTAVAKIKYFNVTDGVAQLTLDLWITR